MNEYIYDMDYIVVVDKIPPALYTDLQYFKLLQKLIITYCDFEVCNLYIPNSVKKLEITFCNMKEFIPINIPKTLEYLNLSNNELIEIPKCIYKLNTTTNIILYDNPFWFLHKTIGAGTYRELYLAYKLNILSFPRMQMIIYEYKVKRLFMDAFALHTLLKIKS